jgi:hypothetical protein
VRIYSDETEENIHAELQARAWARNHFLTAEQKTALDALLPINVRRTNLFLRLLLGGFTLLLVASLIGLVYWALRPLDQRSLAWLCWACAAPSYIAAELFARAGRLYRYGIEEACGLAAAALACAGLVFFLISTHSTWPLTIALPAAIALALFWLYSRFGWMYAAYGAAIALATLPFQFHLSELMARMVLAGELAVIFFFTYAFSTHTRPDFQRSRNQVLQASLLFGIYLTFNLQLESLPLFNAGWRSTYGLPMHTQFPLLYWITYVLCWTHAFTLIIWGLKRRRRVLLDVGILTLGITLATNKDYWGWPYKIWDPILFGLFWIAVAAAAHRWLANKQRAARWQLTGDNILNPDNHGLDPAALGVFLTAPAAPVPGAETAFGEGSSGGAGASRNF